MCLLHEGWRKTEDLIKQMLRLEEIWSSNVHQIKHKFRQLHQNFANFTNIQNFTNWRKTEELNKHVFTP